MLRIKDWSIALELDVKAAVYVQGEIREREFEREKRDREFWTGEVSDADDQALDAIEHRTLPASDDELIARSMLNHR